MTFFALFRQSPMVRMWSPTSLRRAPAFLRRIGNCEEPARRLVDPGIGGLCRQNHSNKKRKCIHMLKLTLRLRSLDRETSKYLMNFIRRIKRTTHPTLRAGGGRIVHRRFDFGLFHSASIMVSLSTKQSAA